MGGLTLTHWLFVGVIVLLLFGGKGKISDIMGDFAKGIKSFKKGLSDDDEAAKAAEQQKALNQNAQAGATSAGVSSQPAHDKPAEGHKTV
jgi:sec-independent protein translocase protein TatA